ncbi:MAG: mannose-1-phosphate guanylyltransferase, partial [Spirochaetia bacterium]|nr:mannose-1-phosphate guanylyltransferase [Spirochaetia bacterium]
MHIILLSGGSGKRVWPLSNDVRSKQFLSLIDDQKGGHESMLKRVYRQIRKVLKDVPILIASGEAQYEQILGEVESSVEVVLEPARRDTFPAIALSCSYLSYEKQVPDDEVVLVLPVDVFADLSYFEVLSRMADVAKQDIARLVLMGIKPSYPASSYGYIQPSEQFSEYALVKGFV